MTDYSSGQFGGKVTWNANEVDDNSSATPQAALAAWDNAGVPSIMRGGWVFLSSATATDGATNLTVSSLSVSQYKYLKFTLKGTGNTTTNGVLLLRFQGQVAGYFWNLLENATATSSNSDTGIKMGTVDAQGYCFLSGEVWIGDATFGHLVFGHGRTGYDTNFFTNVFNGAVNTGSGITSVTINNSAGFDVGTELLVYGMS